MGHDDVRAGERAKEPVAQAVRIVEERLAHPVRQQPHLVAPRVPHQPLVFRVGMHRRRREVERVRVHHEPLTCQVPVKPLRREEGHVVAAASELVGRGHERSHVAEVRG